MTIYNYYQIETIEDSAIKIILTSGADANFDPNRFTAFDYKIAGGIDETKNYVFEINVSDYTDPNKHNFKLLFDQFHAESKSQNNIQLRHNITNETFYVTVELLSNLVLNLRHLTYINNYNYLKSCVKNWSAGIDFLRRMDDFTSATIEPRIKPTSEVIIYIPRTPSLYDQENIVNACGEFMEALGFELKTEDEPVYNSFWQKIKFIFKKNVTEQDVQNLFDKGKKALELKHVELPTAEQTEKLANATEKILHSIEKFDNCTIRLGSLLIVKRMVGPEPILKIHQLTLEEIKYIEENNSLLKDRDPLAFLSHFTHMENAKAIATAMSEKTIEMYRTETTEALPTNENKEVTTDPVVDILPDNITKEGGAHGQAKL